MITLLNAQHNRTAFTCGTPSLDLYLQRQAGQDVRRDVTSVYVLTGENSEEIRGYYTLSAYGLRLGEMPPELQKLLPRYDVLPAYLLGRLAVATSYKGQGLGKWLLVDALRRCVTYRQPLAGIGVVVDAIDETAAAFYRHYHFQPFPDNHQRLFLPMKRLVQMCPP